MPYVPNRRGQKILLQAYREAVSAAAITFQGALKGTLTRGGASNKGSGGQPSSPGDPPAVKTGRLRRSIQVNLTEIKKPDPIARVGTNVVYARIHEFGGVITPKKGKWLWFEVDDDGEKSLRRVRRSILPPRPYFRPTMRDPRVLKRMARTAQAVFAKGLGRIPKAT